MDVVPLEYRVRELRRLDLSLSLPGSSACQTRPGRSNVACPDHTLIPIERSKVQHMA